jgi:hypothetical protein
MAMREGALQFTYADRDDPFEKGMFKHFKFFFHSTLNGEVHKVTMSKHVAADKNSKRYV